MWRHAFSYESSFTSCGSFLSEVTISSQSTDWICPAIEYQLFENLYCSQLVIQIYKGNVTYSYLRCVVDVCRITLWCWCLDNPGNLSILRLLIIWRWKLIVSRAISFIYIYHWDNISYTLVSPLFTNYWKRKYINFSEESINKALLLNLQFNMWIPYFSNFSVYVVDISRLTVWC